MHTVYHDVPSDAQGRVQNFALGDAPNTYRKLATIYNFFPHHDLPWPREIIKACREIDDLFMLGWVRNVYKINQYTAYFDRYVCAVGTHCTRHGQRHSDFVRFPVIVGDDYGSMIPFEILDILEGPQPIKSLPGTLQLFGWDWYWKVKESSYYQRHDDLWGKSEEQQRLELENSYQEGQARKWNALRQRVSDAWDDEMSNFGTAQVGWTPRVIKGGRS